MSLIQSLGSEFPGAPPAAVFYKSSPQSLYYPVIEAIARSDSGVHFFGPAATDGSYVTHLLKASAWTIVETDIASHDCLSLSHSGVEFTNAYYADLSFYGLQERLLLAIDVNDRLHLELFSIAQNDAAVFSTLSREQKREASRSRSGPV